MYMCGVCTDHMMLLRDVAVVQLSLHVCMTVCRCTHLDVRLFQTQIEDEDVVPHRLECALARPAAVAVPVVPVHVCMNLYTSLCICI